MLPATKLTLEDKMVTNELDLIDKWLKNNSDGFWEHHNGITIESTDNPGWIICISLTDKLLKNTSSISRKLNQINNLKWRKDEGSLCLYSDNLTSLVKLTVDTLKLIDEC